MSLWLLLACLLAAADDEARCRSSFSVRAMVRHADWPWMLHNIDADGGNELLRYHACLALAKDSLKPCAKLRGIDDGTDRKPMERICVEDVSEAWMARALLGGPGARELCRRALDAAPGGELKPGAEPALCADVLRAFPDPAAASSAAASHLAKPADAAALHDLAESFRVLAGDCAGVTEHERAYACGLYGALRLAWKTGDPEACGAYGHCRALLGQGKEACRVHLERMRDRFCGRFAVLRSSPTLGALAGSAPADKPLDQPPAALNTDDPKELSRQCRASFTVKRMLSAPDWAWAEQALFSGEGGRDLARHQLCLALASGSAEPCGALPGGAGRECAEDERRARLARALIEGRPEARDLCLQAADGDRAVCDTLQGPDVELLRGRADCSGVSEDMREACSTFAAYRRGSCGKDEVCRALKGEGFAACEPAAERLKRRYCSRFETAEYRELLKRKG